MLHRKIEMEQIRYIQLDLLLKMITSFFLVSKPFLNNAQEQVKLNSMSCLEVSYFYRSDTERYKLCIDIEEMEFCFV